MNYEEWLQELAKDWWVNVKLDEEWKPSKWLVDAFEELDEFKP